MFGNLAQPIPVSNLFPVSNLGRGGDHVRRGKGEPILKCRRCAKEAEDRERKQKGMGCTGGDRSCRKHNHEKETDWRYMGCPGKGEGPEGSQELEAPEEAEAREEIETSEATLDLGEHDLGCDKCQKGRKRRAAQQQYNWMLQGPMLKQVPLVMGNGGRGGGRAFGFEQEREEREAYRYCDPSVEICPLPLVSPVGPYVGPGAVLVGRERPRPQMGCPGHARLGQTCPASPPPLDPTLNCMRDARGNAVCSNGMHFPPGCPHTPPEEYFSPGITPDETVGGMIQGKIPPPRAAGTTGGAGVPGTPGAATGGGTNTLALAAGGIAVAGLLYAILR